MNDRPDLFVRKLHQCAVLFDFNDASAELKGKQIKAAALHEMLDYITTQRGVITEQIYPEVIAMVSYPKDLSLSCYLKSLQVLDQSLPLHPPSSQSYWRRIRSGRRRASTRVGMASSPSGLRVLPSIRREPRLQHQHCETIH